MFAAGRYSDILRAAQDNSVTPGTSPEAAKVVAAAYFCTGEHSDAFNLLVELESTFGHAPDFLSLFAATCRRVGEFKKAEELFKRALKISPDSPEIRNNYSNLLIDLNRYDEASNLLDAVLKEHPSYSDALNNKNRLAAAISNTKKSQLTSSIGQPFTLSDPLMLSFADDEVSYSNKRYFPKRTLGTPTPAVNFPSITESSLNATLSEKFKLAEQAISSGNPSTALQLCSSILNESSQDPRVFDLLSDAYLNLNQFLQAEVCLLHALAIGGPSMKRYLNLTSFSMIKKNFHLAEFYLTQAASIDPSSKELIRIREMLSTKRVDSKPYSYQKNWPQQEATKAG
ncbi:tetratricopeptide repeat protein [bacterium]|nr:tetratricopeptide repeat protein [bacterium]